MKKNLDASNLVSHWLPNSVNILRILVLRQEYSRFFKSVLVAWLKKTGHQDSSQSISHQGGKWPSNSMPLNSRRQKQKNKKQKKTWWLNHQTWIWALPLKKSLHPWKFLGEGNPNQNNEYHWVMPKSVCNEKKSLLFIMFIFFPFLRKKSSPWNFLGQGYPNKNEYDQVMPIMYFQHSFSWLG